MNFKARCQFSDNILEIMKEKKITSTELALRVGLTRITISHYLNAYYTPKSKTIYAIATALGCNVKDLLKGIELEDMV